MRVLVTGNKGLIGPYVEAALTAAGHGVVGFDVATGDNIRNSAAVTAAATDCDAIVHLAALLPPDPDGSEIMATNVVGTWNVLQAAKGHGINRIVYFSSVNALGIFLGDRKPDYLPIDDRHYCYPTSPYSVSKRLGEEMCRFHTEETGAVTICLRPPLVVTPNAYREMTAQWEKDAPSEWLPFWEYGAFLDVRDAASAALTALTATASGHFTALLCAADIASAQPSLEMAEKLLPGVPIKRVDHYHEHPYGALVSTTTAADVLGWHPRYTWRGSSE
jgi:UDP-glucose 4-epimerase